MTRSKNLVDDVAIALALNKSSHELTSQAAIRGTSETVTLQGKRGNLCAIHFGIPPYKIAKYVHQKFFVKITLILYFRQPFKRQFIGKY